MSHARNYFAWQARLVLPHLGRRIVEVGSGIGNFTGCMLSRELVISLELEPACLIELSRRYPRQPNLKILSFDIETDSFLELQSHNPDSCVCLNVLEHVRRDQQAISGMASILPPGGRIVLIVPACPALYGPIDRHLQHHRRYTRAALHTLARIAGLDIQTLHFMNVIGFFAWWTNAHVFRRKLQSQTQIQVFDRFIAPVLSRAEALVPPPVGQSLFAVLRKPAG